jgi:hypothetical protein
MPWRGDRPLHGTAAQAAGPWRGGDVAPAPDDWYANLIWIDRRKCLLVVHADTLFSVFVGDVRKPQLSKFGHYLAGTVATVGG